MKIIQGLGWNVLAAVCIILWTSIFTTLVFGVATYFHSFRVPEEVEIKGLDANENEPAYPSNKDGYESLNFK